MSTKLITQLNPFSTDHNISEIENSSISEIIAKLDKGRAVNTGWRVLLNDEIITDFERQTNDGDTLYVKLVPEGDGSPQSVGKSEKWAGALLTAAGVALLFVPGFGPFAGVALIGAGIGTFANGVLLYNTDFSNPTKDREQPEQSPSIRGSKNQPRPLGYVPILFGKRRFYPDPAINPYTWVDGNGDQYLYQLFCCGQKDQEIDTSSIKIGETPIKEYSSTGSLSSILNGNDKLVQLSISYGGETPPIVTRCVHEDMYNSVLLHETDDGTDASIIKTTPDDTEEINVDIFFYSGLGQYNDEGEVVEASVEVEVLYKKDSEDNSQYKVLGYFKSDSNTITGKELKTKRYSVTRSGLAKGKYTVKVTRKTNDSKDVKVIDTVFLGSIRSIKNQQPVSKARCRELTLVGLKVKVSPKLNGYVEQLNFVSQAKNQIYNDITEKWTTSPTSNPASAAIYAMQGPLSQQKLSSAEIDWSAFETLFLWCKKNNYECNEYVYDSISISELLNSIASTCRAEIFRRNGKITVIQDIERDGFVQVFTPRNSWNYKENIIKADIPDALSLQLTDEASNYAQQELKVYNTPDGNYKSEPDTVQDVPLWGVTSNVQARKLGMYKYAVTKNRPIIHNFSCDFEYMLCSKGDWIKYAGDIALAGITQGRISEVIKNADGSIFGFISDEKIPAMEDEKNYAVRIRLEDGSAVLVGLKKQDKETNLVEFEEDKIINISEGCLFTYGVRGEDSIDLIITDIQCDDDLSASITAVSYSPEIFDVDNPNFVLPDFENRISDIPSVGDSGEFITKEIQKLTQETIPSLEELFKVQQEIESSTDSKIAAATFDVSPKYEALFNTSIIRKGNDGNYSPSKISGVGRAIKGDDTSMPYEGNWLVYVNNENTPFQTFNNTANFELSISDILNVYDNIDNIKVEFKSKSNQIIIDQEFIMVLSGSASYSVILENPFQTYEANEKKELTETSLKTRARVFYGLKELSYLAEDGWSYGIIAPVPGFDISIDVTSGEITIKALSGGEMADSGKIEIPIFIHSQTNTGITIGYENDISRFAEKVIIGFDGVTIGYLEPDENGFYYTYFNYQKLSKTAIRLAQIDTKVDGYWRELTNDLVITVAEKNVLQRLIDSLTAEYHVYEREYKYHRTFAAYETAFKNVDAAVKEILNTSGNYTFKTEGFKNLFNKRFDDYYASRSELNKEISSVSTNFGGISSTDEIEDKKPKPTDFFVWVGEDKTIFNETIFRSGLTYCWSGENNKWVEDKDHTHIMSTMDEAMKWLATEDTEDSNIPAVSFAQTMMASKAVFGQLVTKFASIEKLISEYSSKEDLSNSGRTVIHGGNIETETIDVNKLIVNDAFMDALATRVLRLRKGGVIKSENWDGSLSIIKKGSIYPVSPKDTNIGDYYFKDGDTYFFINTDFWETVIKDNNDPPSYNPIDQAGKYVSTTYTVNPSNKTLTIKAHWYPPQGQPYDKYYTLNIGDTFIDWGEYGSALMMWTGTKIISCGRTGFSQSQKKVSVTEATKDKVEILSSGTHGFIELANGYRESHGEAFFDNIHIAGESTFDGTVNATNSTFSGTVYATDGEFSGKVIANGNSEFRGSILIGNTTENSGGYVENGTKITSGDIRTRDARAVTVASNSFFSGRIGSSFSKYVEARSRYSTNALVIHNTLIYEFEYNIGGPPSMATGYVSVYTVGSRGEVDYFRGSICSVSFEIFDTYTQVDFCDTSGRFNHLRIINNGNCILQIDNSGSYVNCTFERMYIVVL